MHFYLFICIDKVLDKLCSSRCFLFYIIIILCFCILQLQQLLLLVLLNRKCCRNLCICCCCFCSSTFKKHRLLFSSLLVFNFSFSNALQQPTFHRPVALLVDQQHHHDIEIAERLSKKKMFNFISRLKNFNPTNNIIFIPANVELRVNL